MSKANQIAELLTRGVEEVIDRKHLEKRLQGKERGLAVLQELLYVSAHFVVKQ